ncbi:MAG: orotidine-5'-phosphate decarboxylase [Fimbriimonadaceae bacterium]|nr:orotidine-5'-phosphate decarboxylase [Fimbriimonadaceae bacterium]
MALRSYRIRKGMGNRNQHKIICALDTGNLEHAINTVKRLKDYVGAFKIGHALTLPNGLDVIDRLQDAGATRIFLDLKFHDIPNSVAVAVREAAKHRVWMLTVHLSGGPAMLSAAAEEAKMFGQVERPLLVGVSVLTSLDEQDLRDHLGVMRSLEEHMIALSEMGMNAGIDGLVCSVHEASILKKQHHGAVIVTPGIRAAGEEVNDQQRVGDGKDAIDAGSDYLVIGRALTGAGDPEAALRSLRLIEE